MTVKLVAVRKLGAELHDTCLMFDMGKPFRDADVKSVLLLPIIDGVPILVDVTEFDTQWEQFQPSPEECSLFDMLYPESKYRLSDYATGLQLEENI